MGKVNILGVQVDMVNAAEAAGKIIEMLEENRPHSVYTPNSEIIMMAYKDAEFCRLLNDADLLTADGIGVVYDIARLVLEHIAESGHRLFLFGGKPGVAEQAQERLLQEYPFLNIVGCRNGYFDAAEEPEIIDAINRSGADIVFVCLGAPAQEKWIDRNMNQLHVKVLMGIGGSLDVFAGNVERAPQKWQDLRL